ncbi:MAG: permease prefix domain 1-containing protein, partial [Lachnospiraceae bacterium]|nr:permease prefix domain 1-containing protein [Lachnospiraceae bacterium]
MEEFIKTLTEQMRCIKAREGVARELSNHIIDQTAAYEQSGMEHDKAVEKAVHEMGDPVAIGVLMDRIHRPQIDWRMILLTLVLSIAGLFCMMPVYGVEQVL